MSKFKVGDRVRRVKHSGKINNCPVGYETVVDELLGSRGYGFWYVGEDGQRQNSSNLDDWELAGPVRTVTKKEVATGVYGIVHVDEGANTPVVISMRGTKDAAEITAAIETLTAIRDVLAEAP